MIDTLRLNLKEPQRGFDPWKSDHQRWEVRSEALLDAFHAIEGHVIPERHFFRLRTGSMRVGCGYDGRWWAEASLPVLLFGSNGFVIHTDEQKHEALRRMMGELGTIGGGRVVLEPETVARLDSVWQFRESPVEMRHAMKNCTHPACRKKQAIYRGSGIAWTGENEVIRLYDKELEQTGRPGEVTRIEIEARGSRKLPQYMEKKRSFQAFSEQTLFDHWLRYRAELLRFEGIQSVPEYRGCESEFDLLALSFVESEGMAWEIYQRTRCGRQVKRMRAKMRQVRRRYRVLNLSELLPYNIPEPVNVEVA